MKLSATKDNFESSNTRKFSNAWQNSSSTRLHNSSEISGDNSPSRIVQRKTIHDISREIPTYQDPIYRPPPKPIEIPLQEIPRKITDSDMEIKMDFEENSPYQEGVISEIYQRPDKSYFQEPLEMDCLINTGKLVQ